eukprot:superscaffoldBa00002176_g13447
MEVALSGPQIFPEPLRRGTPLPLSQLVEESSSRANIPNHLLESKIYTKVKSNSLIQAEPSELHFSGFDLGKDYLKSLKLINISSEVMNIHIIPTQTKHFQTTYTKKYRLIPGLAYTLKVQFCPDEWRYFYDCVRVHCKGEENLFIPVHAYPVIDDLHIPPHIYLPAVPLGQSLSHAIPLRCSCPIDFEFQVYVIQPHEAFSIHPLADKSSQNLKEASSFQTLTLRSIHGLGSIRTHGGTGTWDLNYSCNFNLTVRDQTGIKPAQKPPVDVCTPAGVAKMLIKDSNKLSSKDLREVMSGGSMVGLQNRQMKEALFIKKVQQNVKEEQANHLRWQVHLGKDPMSEHTRRQVLEEREIALHEYMVKRGDVKQEEDFASGPPKLSSRRVLCEAGQAPEGAPSFQFYSSFHWELKQRALRLFQQAARKVVIRCLMNRRLASLKKLSDSMMNLPSAQKVEEEKTCDLKISSERVFPFSFPIFSDEADQLAPSNLVTVPVDPVDVTVTAHIPFFRLQVPQHYKLMGYWPVSAWEAFNSYIPTTLAKPLRTGAPSELVPQSPRAGEEKQHENEEEDVEAKEARDNLTFSAPEALLRPFLANPLRIFNPAPGLQTYKPTPKYLESDLEFHLCPLPRYTNPEINTCGVKTQTQHTQKKFLDRKGVIKGVMTWTNFDSITLNCLSNQPALTSDFALRRSVDYSTDILPLTAPPPLTGPPDDLAGPTDKLCEDSGVQLTPEMIRAEFLSGEALVSNSNLHTGVTARHQTERQMEATYTSEFNQMGKRVMGKLKHLGVTNRTSHSPGEDRE